MSKDGILKDTSKKEQQARKAKVDLLVDMIQSDIPGYFDEIAKRVDDLFHQNSAYKLRIFGQSVSASMAQALRQAFLTNEMPSKAALNGAFMRCIEGLTGEIAMLGYVADLASKMDMGPRAEGASGYVDWAVPAPAWMPKMLATFRGMIGKVQGPKQQPSEWEVIWMAIRFAMLHADTFMATPFVVGPSEAYIARFKKAKRGDIVPLKERGGKEPKATPKTTVTKPAVKAPVKKAVKKKAAPGKPSTKARGSAHAEG